MAMSHRENVICFQCQQRGHFARECVMPAAEQEQVPRRWVYDARNKDRWVDPRTGRTAVETRNLEEAMEEWATLRKQQQQQAFSLFSAEDPVQEAISKKHDADY